LCRKRTGVELSPERANARALLSLALLAQDRGDEALTEAMSDREEWARLYASAIVHHALGQQWLERAHTQRDPGLTEMNCERLLRSLHGDRRWRAFLRKMGFAE
jgi:hypothetical protein